LQRLLGAALVISALLVAASMSAARAVQFQCTSASSAPARS